MKSLFIAVGLVPLMSLSGLAHAQPMPGPAAPQIEAARDVPYEAGPIKLAVDATDNDRRIFSVHQILPVSAAGPLTLFYPAWLPGNHAPRGPIEQLAGLMITADGQPVAWTRDPVNVFAFHVTVPAGAKALDIRFQFLSPTDRSMTSAPAAFSAAARAAIASVADGSRARMRRAVCRLVDSMRQILSAAGKVGPASRREGAHRRTVA